MLITRHDLSETIMLIKQETGWGYVEMGKRTGIPYASLNKYATKTRFPKDPQAVYRKLKKALVEYKKRGQ